ncbi:MAG TPA: hypothetical protein PKY19_04680 [Oscillospiraceae bacterium]|nr:hypothetical protein [Oscillospiraceae bacterium]HXK77762.1 hypothetical protein [Oscillospiraceae bacterium]
MQEKADLRFIFLETAPGFSSAFLKKYIILSSLWQAVTPAVFALLRFLSCSFFPHTERPPDPMRPLFFLFPRQKEFSRPEKALILYKSAKKARSGIPGTGF